MKPTDWTHEMLCGIACWLAGFDHRHLVALFREPNYLIGGEQPDAFAIWSPYGVSHLVECKVGRGDFIADRKKPFRRNPEYGIGAIRTYLTAPGVVRDAGEIPENWNWYEAVDNDTIMPRLVCDPQEAPWDGHLFKERNIKSEWSLYWLYQRSRWWKKELALYAEPVKVQWEVTDEEDKEVSR